MKILQIGCGGIGGWLAFFLAKTLTGDDELILCDGDIVEEKNLDRQFFDQVGARKTSALRTKLGATRCQIIDRPMYFDPADADYVDIIMSAVDNHKARRLALGTGKPVIVGANEYVTSEGYIYLPEWKKDENLDPLKYYPTILTDLTGDPTSPPCTGEVVVSNPQLPFANMQAATFMAGLFMNWIRNKPTVYTPYRYYSNGGTVTAWRRQGDIENK